jgi:hypothetical protein
LSAPPANSGRGSFVISAGVAIDMRRATELGDERDNHLAPSMLILVLMAAIAPCLLRTA